MKQVIHVIGGPCGAGKTLILQERMAAARGRYLFAIPRIDLIRERVGDLQHHAARAGTRPVLVEIHSDNGQFGSVARQLTDARHDYADAEHVILLVTHEALFSCDLSGFQGWHARIDEVPASVQVHSWSVPASVAFLETAYELVDVGMDGWWKLAPLAGGPAMNSLMRDDFLKGLAPLLKAAQSPQGVFVDVGCWSDLRDSHRRLQWGSVWTPRELATFESCHVASAGYQHSVTHLVTKRLYGDEIEVDFEEVQVARGPIVPRVEISFFTKHRGSTDFWVKDSMGRHCLTRVATHLTGQAIGYWSSNECIRPYFEGRLSGQQVSPKTEGTNSLRRHEACTFIYSAKAQPADAVLGQLFDISSEQILRARETEDMIQFVFRGALRQAGFAGLYRVFLYEEQQAMALREYLDQAGYSVHLHACDDAGIMDLARAEKRGRKPADLSSRAEREEKRKVRDAERQREKRAKEKHEQEAAGVYRRPGRPKSLPALLPIPACQKEASRPPPT